MGSGTVTAQNLAHEVSGEDQLRSQIYSLLAKFLSKTPDAESLAAAAALEGGGSPFGDAIAAFARVAGATSQPSVAEEYQNLFIGVGRGELLPYGSYYLTGFLHEKPLARLRSDMADFGIARNDAVSEPEDHVASILEAMAGLIDGRFGTPATLEQQKEFFDAHIGSWMPVFFQDLAGASSSVLYAAFAQVGLTFLEIETEAFRMD